MDGIIYDIKRFALHDGPGIRSTVFFKGCPLGCWWCHNPESRNPCIEKTVKLNKLEGKEIEVEEQTGYRIESDDLLEEIKKDIAFMDESGGGVTFSGGEPLLQPGFLSEILKICRKEKIHTALDTSGYSDESTFQKIAVLSDLVLFDIKHLDEEKHVLYTGVSNKKILINLDFLHKIVHPVIIRFPVIPGINDSGHIKVMIKELKNRYPRFTEIHLLPYHNIASHKYLRFNVENRMDSISSLTKEQIEPVVKDFKSAGFIVKVGG